MGRKTKEVKLSIEFPDRRPNEPDATEKQLDYIRSFEFALSENVLSELGKWQASNVIDQMQNLRSEGLMGQSAGKSAQELRKKKEAGPGCLVVMIGALVLVSALLSGA
jgi:hypothetical protein